VSVQAPYRAGGPDKPNHDVEKTVPRCLRRYCSARGAEPEDKERGKGLARQTLIPKPMPMRCVHLSGTASHPGIGILGKL
jgi:hypothetical protein